MNRRTFSAALVGTLGTRSAILLSVARLAIGDRAFPEEPSRCSAAPEGDRPRLAWGCHRVQKHRLRHLDNPQGIGFHDLRATLVRLQSTEKERHS